MKVKIKLLTEMLGTVTKDPEVYKTYMVKYSNVMSCVVGAVWR